MKNVMELFYLISKTLEVGNIQKVTYIIIIIDNKVSI